MCAVSGHTACCRRSPDAHPSPQTKDKTSKEYQRMTWEALKKSINGLVNKVNVSNIKAIVVELLRENVIRGRALLVRSLMKAQGASPNFSHVYAALIAVINTKMPEVQALAGEALFAMLRE